MLNNFIYAQTKDLFLEALGAGNILDEAIVFIEDTREIWNHGHYFGGETIDPSIISDLQTAVAQMQSSKLDSSTAESTYAKKTELPSLDGYLTENAANALYVKVSDMQGISTVISNLQTEISTKADKATTIAGYGITDVYTKTESDARFTMLPITYSELVTLRDNGQLIPGQQYRITDYVTTTAQENTKSAGHQFDIIVTADSENTLNEKARAIQHEGDTYFANSDLSAWEIWYCLDNDEDRFAWANPDETETQVGTIRPLSGVSGSGTYKYDIPISRIVFNNNSYAPTIGTRTMINSGPPVHVTLTDAYTLVVEDPNVYLTANGIFVYGISHAGKGVIYRMIDENGNDCPYDFKNIMFRHPDDPVNYYYTFGGVNGDRSLIGLICCNIINKYVTAQSMYLNNIIIKSGNNNYFGFDCHNNYIEGGNDNSFGSCCYNNFFGDSCHDNTFGKRFHDNSFGNNCAWNTFGTFCYENFVGNFFNHNSFGNNCHSNKFIQTTSAPTEYRSSINGICLDNSVCSMTVVCGGTDPMQNIHFHNGVTGTVNIDVTNSERQINVYRINYGSVTAGTNAIDYGERYKHVTTSVNINVYDRHIICDNTSAITLTLPTGFPGAEFYIHKRSAQSVTVTLASTGSQYISTGHSSKTTENRALTETLSNLGTSKVMWDPSANEWLRIYMG